MIWRNATRKGNTCNLKNIATENTCSGKSSMNSTKQSRCLLKMLQYCLTWVPQHSRLLRTCSSALWLHSYAAFSVKLKNYKLSLPTGQ